MPNAAKVGLVASCITSITGVFMEINELWEKVVFASIILLCFVFTYYAIYLEYDPIEHIKKSRIAAKNRKIWNAIRRQIRYGLATKDDVEFGEDGTVTVTHRPLLLWRQRIAIRVVEWCNARRLPHWLFRLIMCCCGARKR